MSFETFLDTFPPPWKADEYAGVSAIVDSKGNEVDTALRKAFANFVVELVNTHADAIARKDALLAEAATKIDELRRERDDARRSRDEWNSQRIAAQEDAAELHDLVGVQRELIDHLQNRIKRLEAKR